MATKCDREPMDLYFAVFNEHINQAGKRAVKDVRRKFGTDGEKAIKALRKSGIMVIFKSKPTPLTEFYAERVKQYVNEGAVSRG